MSDPVQSTPAPASGRGAHMAKYRAFKSAFDFSVDLQRAAEVLAVETVREATVLLAMTLINKITLRTPVDTGRARANWFMAEGAPRIETTESTTPQTYTTAGLKGESVIYITNSLPYIVPLEYGHSEQAPNGMVRIAIAEVQMHVNVGRAA